MKRQLARINTLQSINAKASQMEMVPEMLVTIEEIIGDSIRIGGEPEPFFAVADLVDFANNCVTTANNSIADRLEDIAAFLVLTAQKEREKNAQGS